MRVSNSNKLKYTHSLDAFTTNETLIIMQSAVVPNPSMVFMRPMLKMKAANGTSSMTPRGPDMAQTARITAD
ncbi:hypothetical protein CEXT_324911 [Caerostris extrusa]|uniref:Uncharacterized protein n=1 Tax=Caerostris extrusa TaxID=172846 RepID=A0AAV4MGA3_CAEEX|nr:hypothetical protein CEXT_324911 [Caerostris extrusa]